MKTYRPRTLDPTKILTRRELAAVLADLNRKAPRSRSTRLNLVVFRLACCCGLRASEIARLRTWPTYAWNSRRRISASAEGRPRAAGRGWCRCGGMPARWRIWRAGNESDCTKGLVPRRPL